MRNTRFGLVLLLGTACLLLGTGEAQAQFGFNGGGYGYGYGYDIGRLYSNLGNNVPYYAAYPPVYYSAPVPRTYGYSPFAYPPGVRTPEIVEPVASPKEVLNPYVPSTTPASLDKDDQVTHTDHRVQPLVILNPYVTRQLAKTVEPALQAAR